MILLTEQSCIGQHLYIPDTTDLSGVKSHYQPHNQCPACFDIGQDVYQTDKQWVLRCPYCKCQYIIKFEGKG